MKFKNLDRYRTGGTPNNMKLSIPPPKTPDGRIYRYSPNEKADPRLFVIGERKVVISPTEQQTARMKLIPGSARTVCPYSGLVADDADFTHPDDIKAAKDLVAHAAVEDVRAAIGAMFDGLSKRHSRGPVKIESKKSRPKPKPRFVRKDLMRELACDHCGRDYGVFAISLFCPDCGAPNLRLHFEREVELVGKQVDLAEGQDRSQEELAYRLLGNAHEDVLTAFEATLKTAFAYGVAHRPEGSPPVKEVKNDFQNVVRGRERFAIFEFDPFASLSGQELKALELNIQKRHVIGHNLGVVDSKFAAMADDAKLGETVALVGDDIRAFAAIAVKVVGGLDQWLVDLVPPLPTAVVDEPDEVEAQIEVADPEVRIGDLGPLASRLGSWLCAKDETGIGGPLRSNDELLLAFEGTQLRDIEDAIAELELEGYVETTHFLGGGLPHINVKSELFIDFDPVVRSSSPLEDAADLIERITSGPENIGTADLHAESGLPLRRFNPALAYILGHIDERRISQVWDNQYPARSFFLVAEDRVALRRLAERLRG